MLDLYVLGLYDESGNFVSYVRKGRSNSISGYDSLGSAKRGLGQTNSSFYRILYQNYSAKIIRFDGEIAEVIE